MQRQIMTIGYEGARLEDFMATLQRARIDLLIDVREVALSRKRGFSKTQLAAALASAGIRYCHLRGLGDPKEGRLAARAGDYPRFRRVFAAHMRSAAALADLETAAALATVTRACLMCFEQDHALCHRSIVAERLAALTELAVLPLIVHSAATLRLAA